VTALDFPDNPTAGQVFDRWTFDGTKWVLAALQTPDSKLLAITSEKLEARDTFMNATADIDITDVTPYPFPTIFDISVSALYMKPDRATPVSASMWSTVHQVPDAPGNGAMLTYAEAVNSGGAGWTALGDMSASFIVPANSGVGMYLRLNGVQGGPTQYSYSALVTKKRWKA
jgi:hypothetical protein